MRSGGGLTPSFSPLFSFNFWWWHNFRLREEFKKETKNSHVSFIEIPYMLIFLLCLFCSLLSLIYIHIFPPPNSLNSLQTDAHYAKVLQCVLLKHKNILLHNHSSVIKIRTCSQGHWYSDSLIQVSMGCVPHRTSSSLSFSFFMLPSELVLKWGELYHFLLQKAFVVAHFLQNYIQHALYTIQGPFYLSGILWLNLAA